MLLPDERIAGSREEGVEVPWYERAHFNQLSAQSGVKIEVHNLVAHCRRYVHEYRQVGGTLRPAKPAKIPVFLSFRDGTFWSISSYPHARSSVTRSFPG